MEVKKREILRACLNPTSFVPMSFANHFKFYQLRQSNFLKHFLRLAFDQNSTRIAYCLLKFKGFTRNYCLPLEFVVSHILECMFKKFLQIVIAITREGNNKLILNRFCALCNFNRRVHPTQAHFKIYKAMFQNRFKDQCVSRNKLVTDGGTY